MRAGGQRIGVIGCGNIAGIVAGHGEHLVDIVACYDIDQSRMHEYAERTGARACDSLEELLQQDFPVLLEAASVEGAQHCVLPGIRAGKDVVVLSVGALYDASFLDEARRAAATAGRRIHVPSGAIYGLDNLKVARLVGLDQFTLKSSKHPRALGLDNITARTCVFRGKAMEAVRKFPKNINVSSALGLATGTEPDVEIWADPGVENNRHEIHAVGEFGEVTIIADNRPSPENPATSYLAALSVLALLRKLGDPLQIGS